VIIGDNPAGTKDNNRLEEGQSRTADKGSGIHRSEEHTRDDAQQKLFSWPSIKGELITND
jgi:hypothetical protein